MNSYTDDEIEKACWNYVWAQTEWGVRFDLYKTLYDHYSVTALQTGPGQRQLNAFMNSEYSERRYKPGIPDEFTRWHKELKNRMGV